MTFTPSTYANFVSESSAAQERLFLRYIGPRDDFDIVIVGSGMGGGILADDLADRVGKGKRILVLEAGSFIYPTHVYNMCRFPNAKVAQHFACDTFWQDGNSGTQNFIGERSGNYDNDQLESYWTTDAAVTWETPDRRLQVGVTALNLFDQRYDFNFDVPAPGRTVAATVKARF